MRYLRLQPPVIPKSVIIKRNCLTRYFIKLLATYFTQILHNIQKIQGTQETLIAVCLKHVTVQVFGRLSYILLI